MKGSDFHVTPAERQWEKVTVDEATRMRLNGESAQCMAHMKAMKKAGGVSLREADGADTSKDQDWPLDESCFAKCADMYCLITTGLWLVPKVLIFVIPMLLLELPAFVLLRSYVATLKPGTDKVRRSGRFWMSFVLASLLFFPAGILAIVSLMVDYLFYWLFGITFCIFTSRYCAVWRSMKALNPYRNGPWIISHLPDIYVALTGQTARQGIFEIAWSLSNMLLFIPWFKYYVTVNPWLQNLDHRFTSQITTSMSDIAPAEHCASILQEIVSRAKHHPGRARKVDLWSFVPHYPSPPPGRRYALGLQQGVRYTSPLIQFLLIVHTTHANSCDGNSTEQHVASNSCQLPIYRVILWYNNPYHFLTAWVEASISTGGPSQPEKVDGGEHPMWGVSSASPLAAGRASLTGLGVIDSFFDYWLPVLVHEVRYSHHRMAGKSHQEALQIANDMYQEVHSKDGISRPIADKVGLDQYHGDSAYDDYGLPKQVTV